MRLTEKIQTITTHGIPALPKNALLLGGTVV